MDGQGDPWPSVDVRPGPSRQSAATAMRRCTAGAIPGQATIYGLDKQRKTASALKRDLPMGESTIMVEAMAVESIAMAVEDDGGDGRWR